MVATFLSEMGPFVVNIATFPTAIYTVFLSVCVVFWLVALLGFVDIDLGMDMDLDLEFDVDVDVDIDADVDVDAPGNTGLFAGLLLRFGLVGVPITISMTILALVGWLLCYYAVHFLFPLIPGALFHYLAGIPIFLVTLVVAAKATGFIIRPLKTFFANATQQVDKKLLGQTAIVRTSRVDNDFGEAVFDDGGAGLIMKIRSKGETRFSKGDKVIILQRLNDDNVYEVISEEEFLSS